MIKFWTILLSICSVLLLSAFSGLPDGVLHAYFLDVGQGDSIFIRTPSGKNILVDGGGDDKVLTELADVMPFFDRSLDLVVLTHAHSDHINGLVSVLKRYKVSTVLVSGAFSKGAYYREFLDSIGDAKLLIAESSHDFDFGDGAYFDVIFPIESINGQHFENTNNTSIVGKVVYGSNAILLTGDAEIESENWQLATDFDLSADIIKLGHHGSKTASSLGYLKNVMPASGVIQCGIDNKFGHPHAESMENFSTVSTGRLLRNDFDGRVHFVFDQDQFFLSS
jgi:competence protein ComEC